MIFRWKKKIKFKRNLWRIASLKGERIWEQTQSPNRVSRDWVWVRLWKNCGLKKSDFSISFTHPLLYIPVLLGRRGKKVIELRTSLLEWLSLNRKKKLDCKNCLINGTLIFWWNFHSENIYSKEETELSVWALYTRFFSAILLCKWKAYTRQLKYVKHCRNRG